MNEITINSSDRHGFQRRQTEHKITENNQTSHSQDNGHLSKCF